MMPYSPLGGFSIFDKPNPSWENAKADAKRKSQERDAYWQNVYNAIFTPENETRFQRAVDFTNEWNQTHDTNFTIDQVLNAYALAHPRMNFLTVGPVKIDQVERTTAALALSKSFKPEHLNYLYKV